jgi:transmembrane sensor
MDIKQMLVRYRSNQCTEQEAVLLLAHIKSGKDRRLVEKFIEENLRDSSREKAIDETASLLEEAFENIISRTEQEARDIRIFSLVSFRNAAAVLLVLGIGLFSYLRTRDRAETGLTYSAPGMIIPSGLNQSTLTLSDGRIIDLDQAGKGEIPHPGPARIYKTADGELEYLAGAQFESGWKRQYNTLSVSKGGTCRIRLPDATRVRLNAGSSLRFPAAFNESDRTVELIGEGYFEVTKDIGRPFRVRSSQTEVTVLGTVFNMNAYRDEPFVKTTLVEGSLKLSGKKNDLKIKPGQQAQYNKDGFLIASPANVRQVLGWKEGVFIFSGNRLEEVLRQIARWYDVTLVYKDGKVPDIKIGGEMTRSARLQEVVEVLNASGTNISIKRNSLIINP